MFASRFFVLIPCVALVLLGAGCGNASESAQQSRTVPPVSESENAVTTPTKPNGDSVTPSSTMNNLAFPGVLPAEQVNKKVRIKTNKGDIVVQVSRDMGPNAASNFVYLVKQGFYNGTIFHRVIDGFMIQGGDPTGTGAGGPGYQFANDKVALVNKMIPQIGRQMPSYEKGWIAMANAGRDTNGSQFFIMVADYPLPPDYSVFGKVVEGQAIADAIAKVETMPGDRPVSEVKMLEVTIEE